MDESTFARLVNPSLGACDNYLSDLTRGAPGYPVASNQDLSKKGLGSGRRSWLSRGDGPTGESTRSKQFARVHGTGDP